MIPNTEDLFAHYCTHGLTMPDDFTKAPAFLILKNQLSSEQTRQLSALLDEQALTSVSYTHLNLFLFCQAHKRGFSCSDWWLSLYFLLFFRHFHNHLSATTKTSTNFTYIMVLLLFYSGYFADWRGILGMVYWFLQARNNNYITKILHILTRNHFVFRLPERADKPFPIPEPAGDRPLSCWSV